MRRRSAVPNRTAVVLLAAAVITVPATTAAQSLLARTPNLAGGWTGVPGTLYFNFLHRFARTTPPARKVSNSPTFLVAAGLPWRTLAGFNYATNSDVAPRYPNEWEFFGRVGPLRQDLGHPADVALQVGYNLAARSTDAELAAARRVGPLQLQGAARWLSNAHDLGDARTAVAGGALLLLGSWAAVGGDYGTMLDAPDGFDPAWSAAIHLAIPYTPHSLSLHVTNTSTATLQGASAARGNERRYGFEFTVPLTLRRYLTRPRPAQVVRDSSADALVERAVDTLAPAAAPVVEAPTSAPQPVAAADSAPAAAADTARAPSHDTIPARADTTVRTTTPPRRAAPPPRRSAQAGMRQLTFTPQRIEIAAGGTVTWTNRDAVIHTVTDAGGRWDSGLIEPGAKWSRRFDRPGTYTIHCTPHPFMKATVVVRAVQP